MPPIALWLCFAASAQPRRFRQPQKLDASRSSQKAGAALQQVLEQGQTRCSRLQRNSTAALIGLVPRTRLSGSDRGSPISALADNALIDEPHIQLSLLDAEFPVLFKATEKRGETSVRLCVERRARYHNSFLISLRRLS